MLPEALALFFCGMFGTLITVRTWLLVSPSTNAYLFGYNVHHLYTGALALITLSVVSAAGWSGWAFTVLSGIASGLIVDQLVYLVTSKGGQDAYYKSKSVLGM